MESAFVVDVLRTPIGKYGGMLATVRPDDLAAFVIRKILERNLQLDPASIEDVIFGKIWKLGLSPDLPLPPIKGVLLYQPDALTPPLVVPFP